MTSTTCYSVDTSALLDGAKRHYPARRFKTLWDNLAGLVSDGRLFGSEEVWEEVQVHDDELKTWIAARRDYFVIRTDAAITAEVTALLASNPRLVMNLKGRNRADPFVIALAKLRGATVVTGEGSDGTPKHPKIPFVCAQISIPCVRLLDVIDAEGWVF